MTIAKLALAGAAAALIAGSAQASQVFDFSFSNLTDSGSGTFTSSSSAYPYLISAITGTFDGSPITGLSSYAAADNTIYTSTAPYLSLGGVSFASAGGDYNLYTYLGADYLLKSSVDPVGFPQNGQPILLTITAIPEPATWALMTAGLFGLGALTRRRAAMARVA